MCVLASRAAGEGVRTTASCSRADWRARVCRLDSRRCRAWERSSMPVRIISSSSSSSRRRQEVSRRSSCAQQPGVMIQRSAHLCHVNRASSQRHAPLHAWLPPADVNNGYRQLYSDRPTDGRTDGRARNKLYGILQRRASVKDVPRIASRHVASRGSSKTQLRASVIPQLRQRTYHRHCALYKVPYLRLSQW